MQQQLQQGDKYISFFLFYFIYKHIVYLAKQSQTSLQINKSSQTKNIKTLTQNNYFKNKKIRKTQKFIQSNLTQCIQNQKTNKYQVKKKIHKNSQIKRSLLQSHKLDFNFLADIYNLQQRNFFTTKETNLFQQNIVFSNSSLLDITTSKNQLLKRTIQIISNQNQRICIPIHQGLYKSNITHKNQQNLNQTSNRLDFQLKNQYIQSIQFIRDYKNGYAPIQMQKKNQDEQDLYENDINRPDVQIKDKNRSHFIRKQQSSLRIPRTCGVSYIKKSQSLLTQKYPFKPLPPLIFQGSSNLRQQFQQTSLQETKIDMIRNFLFKMENIWIPFIISDQTQMRDLLLNKKTLNAKVAWVQGIQNLWPLFIQGTFILLIITQKLLLNQKQVWKAFLNKQSYFKIGILAKKSTSGAKAFLKSIKIDSNDIQIQNSFNKQVNNQQKFTDLIKESSSSQKRILNVFQILEQQLKGQRAVVTMSLRFQMYVEQYEWKQLYNKSQKQMLNEIIIQLKIRFEKKSIKIIQDRFEIKQNETDNPYLKQLQFLRIQKNLSFINTQSEEFIQQKNTNVKKRQNNFTLKLFQEFNSNQSIELLKNTRICSVSDLFLKNQQQLWRKSLKFPIYFISTRDSFAFDLIEKVTLLKRGKKQYQRIDYYFYPDNVPTNFNSEYRKLFPNFEVGVTSYHGFFSQQQLKEFQQNVFQMEKNAFKNKFLQMTVQPSIVSVKVKRTKFFFGYRYMWTKNQLAQPASYVAAGVRKDVTPPPKWTKYIEKEMVKQKMVEKDFINSVAVNVYHDGKQGLAQHFDDAVRFKQPIYTLRLFSDARLSFGSQFYGFCNGAFIIPLPRGCICVMEQNSYAANCVKHCVRPCDMTGKSAAVILRQMHNQVVKQSSKYDEYIDFPAWLSCLNQKQNAFTFAQQKRMESQYLVLDK